MQIVEQTIFTIKIFLDKQDKEFIKGYDYAVEVIANMIRYNLDTYEQELNDVLEEGFKAELDEVYSTRDDLYEIIEENKEIIANVIEVAAESERDMMITSMIDNMDDDEYEKNRQKVLKENNGKKEYYDTEYFSCTGKKRFRPE